MSESAEVTKEQQLRLKIKDYVREFQASLFRLQAQVEGYMHIRIGLQLQIDELISVSEEQSAAWSTTRSAPRDVSADLLQLVELRKELAAAEECAAAICQQLQGMQQTPRTGKEACNVWELMLQLQGNRWHNRSSLLLSLPLVVLRIITHRAGKATRLACSTLRDAHGAPGTGVLLSHPEHAQPAAASVDASLRAWPQPGDVTQLRALSFLPASTCEALSRTFPRLQAVSVLGNIESCAALAPGGVTSLMLATSDAHKGPEDTFLACSRHFSALRSLCLTDCAHRALLSDLTPLSALARLTSLTLSRHWHLHDETTAPPDAREPPHPEQAATRCSQQVWGVLAQLPKLARLRLDVAFNYHSDMPAGVGPLASLTHLAVFSEASMVTQDRRRDVEVPFVKVLGLLPALVSLHFLAGNAAMSIQDVFFNHGGVRGLEHPLLLQALRQHGLQDLQLSQSFAQLSSNAFASLLTPSLTSLKCTFPLELTPPAVLDRFHASAHLKSLDITYSSAEPRRLAEAVELLPAHLPGVTHLALRARPDPSATHMERAVRWGEERLGANEEGLPIFRPAPIPSLAELSNLQQLHISGGVLVAIITESLPLLQALTRLELPDLLPTDQASVLAALTGLRSLHLGQAGRRRRVGEGLSFDAEGLLLQAVKRMRRLTELGLSYYGWSPKAGASMPEFERLRPVPVMLRRLVVDGVAARNYALRVLGGDVDEIRCAVGSTC